jgi:hypothetical protein
MLTKSLHTVTAATNVARYVLETTGAFSGGTALAYKALEILGHGPGSDVGDVTWQRIVKACDALCAERAATIAKRKNEPRLNAAPHMFAVRS